jgi:hypothetical protein
MTKVFYRAILTEKVIPARWTQPFFSQIMIPQRCFHIPCFLSRNLGLRGVATLASEFASPFGSSDWASLAGLWHDLGKYSKAFQQMIKLKSGFDPEAHLEGKPGRVDHSTAGALLKGM